MAVKMEVVKEGLVLRLTESFARMSVYICLADDHRMSAQARLQCREALILNTETLLDDKDNW